MVESSAPVDGVHINEPGAAWCVVNFLGWEKDANERIDFPSDADRVRSSKYGDPVGAAEMVTKSPADMSSPELDPGTLALIGMPSKRKPKPVARITFTPPAQKMARADQWAASPAQAVVVQNPDPSRCRPWRWFAKENQTPADAARAFGLSAEEVIRQNPNSKYLKTPKPNSRLKQWTLLHITASVEQLASNRMEYVGPPDEEFRWALGEWRSAQVGGLTAAWQAWRYCDRQRPLHPGSRDRGRGPRPPARERPF